MKPEIKQKIEKFTAREEAISLSTHCPEYEINSTKHIIIGTMAMKKMFFRIYCYKVNEKSNSLDFIALCDLRKFKLEPTISHCFLRYFQPNPIFVLIGKVMKKKASVVLAFDCSKIPGLKPMMKKEIKGLGTVGRLTAFDDRVLGINDEGMRVVVNFKS